MAISATNTAIYISTKQYGLQAEHNPNYATYFTGITNGATTGVDTGTINGVSWHSHNVDYADLITANLLGSGDFEELVNCEKGAKVNQDEDKTFVNSLGDKVITSYKMESEILYLDYSPNNYARMLAYDGRTGTLVMVDEDRAEVEFLISVKFSVSLQSEAGEIGKIKIVVSKTGNINNVSRFLVTLKP